MSVPEKRRRHNVQKLASFLGGGIVNGEVVNVGSGELDELGLDLVLRIIRSYRAHQTALEAVMAYARRHRSAAEELTAEDLLEVRDALLAAEVHGS